MPPLAGWTDAAVGLPVGEPARLDHEVVELPLLLPRWQASAIEEAARSRGMTTGQMLRRVLADVFSETRAAR
jgi:hypothetical protein